MRDIQWRENPSKFRHSRASGNPYAGNAGYLKPIIPLILNLLKDEYAATKPREEVLLTKLISFDIDGTLEVGDPPGCITLDLVRAAQAHGCIIGSCSDRTVSNQQRLWRENALPMQFTVLKHQLPQVKAEFAADQYIHIGDTEIDRQYAERSGFQFLLPEASVAQLWEGSD